MTVTVHDADHWLETGEFSADNTAMIWNFAKGRQRMTCESREAMLWYELVVTAADGVARVERYTERAQLLRRQHELLCAWKAQGWEEVEPQPAHVPAARR